MKTFGGRLIERYVLMAILPYLGLSLLLLTFVLLAQQAGKFVEMLDAGDPSITAGADILIGLIPNIMIFTLPMAVLAGTTTGFSRLGVDSELIAIRAAGVGMWRIVLPVLSLGVAATLLTLLIGFEVAPKAATLIKQAAFNVTLSKLNSPIQPRTFNTEMPGKVVYVRDGDKSKGQWERVFIHWQEGENVRLVTARRGRIDITGEQTELVLTDAVVTTLPPDLINKGAQVVTESSDQFRVRLNTGRNAILKRFQERRKEPDELRWEELRDRVDSSQGVERFRLLLAFHKRLALCCSPLAFALLGVGLGGRAKRVGRGRAVLLSLGCMIVYYLILLGGEQLSRTGLVAPPVGVWLATGLALLIGLISLFTHTRGVSEWRRTWKFFSHNIVSANRIRRRTRGHILLGLLDQSLLSAVCINFTLAYLALLLIFLIFTLFELLRFISVAEWKLVGLYFLYLVPLASMSLVPISVLIAVLVTYSLLSRRSEVIVWWASGQSLYRLFAPTLFFSLMVSGLLGLLQENVLPHANQQQEYYRALIRGGPNRATTPAGFHWLAVENTRRLYSYKYEEENYLLHNPVVYEFDAEGVHLARIISSSKGVWKTAREISFRDVKIVDLDINVGGHVTQVARHTLVESTPSESFKPLLIKPAELSSRALSRHIRVLKSVKSDDVAQLNVVLYRRAADLLAPVIMCLIGVPFGIVFGRRSAFLSLSAAILIGLLFWASASGFQQLGNFKLLPAYLAAWASPLIFTTLGVLLFARART